MTVHPTTRRAAYSSPWLFAGLLIVLSLLACWMLMQGLREKAVVKTSRGVFVPVYDPTSGRAVARWQPDWPAGVPVPTTQQVMARALAAAEVAEADGTPAESTPEIEAHVAPAPSLASLRRACVNAARRGQDTDRACDRFAAASRPTLPAAVVRPVYPASGSATTTDAPNTQGRLAEAAVQRWLNGDSCATAAPHGSVAWRTCRIRYGEHLNATCHEWTQAELAIDAKPGDRQRQETRAVCAASRRYQAIDN